MSKKIYQKFIFHLSLLGSAASVLVGFYDVIFGTIWEAIHLVLEIIEIGLDRLIERVFETGLRETQVIVFYIMLVIGGIFIYFAWKILVYAVRELIQVFGAEWLEFKNTISEDWRAMPVMNRIFWLSVFLVMNYLASFLLF